MGVNTKYCFDNNGSQEFKCECNDDFDGKRCEIFVCPLICENYGECKSEINNITNIKEWKCDCFGHFEGKQNIQILYRKTD